MPIKNSVCFVLGAGASIPYGFPSGRELTTLAVQQSGALKESVIPSGVPGGCIISEAHLMQFQTALSQSGQYSVDAFLERRQEFVNVGKSVIAFNLIDRENIGHLFRHDNNENWYQYLLSLMQGNTLDDFADNSVSFITYNYDRSLERYLHTALLNTFGADPSEVLQQIPIVHLHGKLADLPEENAERNRPYGREKSPDFVRVAAESIKILHEGTDDSPEYGQSRQLMQNAEVVLFLGFGFHPTNVRRLLKDVDPGGNTMIATRIGITDDEWQSGVALLFREFGFPLPQGVNQNCLQILRNSVRYFRT